MIVKSRGPENRRSALRLLNEHTETTDVYLQTSLALKEKALAKVSAVGKPFRRFQASDKLPVFLAA
jgi:hypothetical protein